MLSNSINWLIDCKKAQTSRQPQSCTRQPSWPGACADVSVCRALAVAPRGRGGGGGKRIVAGCPLLSQARMFDSPHWQNSRSHHNGAWNHSRTSKKRRETNSNHVDVCRSPPPPTSHPFLSLCLRWQTWRDTPLPTFLRACRHATELVTMATTASTNVYGWCYGRGERGLVGTRSTGEWKRIWFWCLFLFALSSLPCLFEMTLTPTMYAAKTLWSVVSF